MTEKDPIQYMIDKLDKEYLNKEAEEFIDYVENSEYIKEFVPKYYEPYSTDKIISVHDTRFPYFLTGDRKKLEGLVGEHKKRVSGNDKSDLISYEEVVPVFIYDVGNRILLDGKDMKYHKHMVELGYMYDSDSKIQQLHWGTKVLPLTKKNLMNCLENHCIRPQIHEERKI